LSRAPCAAFACAAVAAATLAGATLATSGESRAAFDVDALPLAVEPAAPGSRAPAALSDAFAVVATGDGGLAPFVRALAAHLGQAGIPVVLFDSLRFFWTARSADEAGAALRSVVESYSARLGRRRVLLVGYSRGADALPFMASRLPAAVRERVAGIALLGPAPRVALAFHWLDWVRDADDPHALDVVAEVAKLSGVGVLCVYGLEETASACPLLAPGVAAVVARPGGHHFGGDAEAVARLVLDAAARGAEGPAAPSPPAPSAPPSAAPPS
jgi:type IV secretory pathway VirJ component